MRISRRSGLLALALLGAVPVSPAAAQQPAALRGDVDGDGRVTAADAQAVRDHVAGRPARPGVTILPNGDANGDGRITGVDAAMIQAFAAGRDVSRFGVGKPVPRGAGEGASFTVLMECDVDVEEGTQRCHLPRPEGGAGMDMIAGKAYVTFITTGAASSRGDAANEDTTVMNVAIQNLMDHPIGTVDGVTPHPNGNRVFLHSGPTVTAVKSGTLASATIRMDNADGTADFTGPDGSYSAPNRKYYQYNGVLAKNAASAPKLWRFVFSANTRLFSYRVYVSAPVQYEFGRVAVTAASPLLGVAKSSEPLTAVVYDAFGAVVSDAVSWSSSDPSVATVDAATGVVTGVAEGTVTITATSAASAQRKGTVTLTVIDGVLWMGTVSSDWSDAANWMDARVPGAADKVHLPASAPNMPALTADAHILSLQARAGSTLALGGWTLQVMDDVNAAGPVSGGTLWLRGSGAGLQGSVPTVLAEGAVSVQGATRASGPVRVTGSLTIADQALSISVP